MKYFLIFSIINICFFSIMGFIFYKVSKKFEDLGKHKVKYTKSSVFSRRTLQFTYYLKFVYDNQEISQSISKNVFDRLFEEGEIEVYIRKYNNIMNSPNFNKYEISLDEVDWKKKDVKSYVIATIFFILVAEFVAAMCIFQIDYEI